MVDMHHDMIKPREIREKMRGRVHPDSMKIIEKMAEDAIQSRMQIAQLATSLAICTGLLRDVQQYLGMNRPPPSDPVSDVKQLGLPEGSPTDVPTRGSDE